MHNMLYPDFRTAMILEFRDPNAEDKAKERLRGYTQGKKSFQEYVKGFREIL